MAGGVVHIQWYATGFRADALAEELAAISRLSLRHGASAYTVYRGRDDSYRFRQWLRFGEKLDFERFWYGDDFNEFRARCSGWYQVPVIYEWHDVVAEDVVVFDEQTPAQA